MSGRLNTYELFNDITNNENNNNNQYSQSNTDMKVKKSTNVRNVSNASTLRKNHSLSSKKKNVTYLTKEVVNQIARDIRMKKEISKETNKLKKEISKVESEIVRYQTRYVPDIKYEISKRQVMCKKLQNQYDSFQKEIDDIDKQIDNIETTKKNVEKELLLKYEDLETNQSIEYENKLNELKISFENDIKNLDNLSPAEPLEKEINDLRDKLLDYLEQSDSIKLSNKQRLKDKENVIKQGFEEFKVLKENEFDNFIKQSEILINDISHQNNQKDELNNMICKLNENLQNIQSKLNDIENELLEINNQYDTLHETERTIKNTFDLAYKDLQTIQERARLQDEKYNDYYNKMELELTKRKKLENSIDEMKGLIRCFLYTEDSNLPGFTIDYLDNVVLLESSKNIDSNNINNNNKNSCEDSVDEIKDEEIYLFSRIIPSNALSVPQLIFREYKPYHDMCISGKHNFTLFSISIEPWSDFQAQFIEFLIHEYSGNYEINFQNVFLSDNNISKDLLAVKDEDNLSTTTSSCINIKFDNENNLLLNTISSPLTEHVSNKRNKLISINYDSTNGINMYKFQFKKRKLYCKDSNESDVINFYLIQFEDINFINKLSNYMLSRKSNQPSHVGYMINRLMKNLKSCFLFNLSSISTDPNDGKQISHNDIQTLLEIGTNIGKIPNLQRKKQN